MREYMSRKPENSTSQLEKLVDVFAKSGEVEFVGGREFRRMERFYSKKGSYGRLYGGFLSYASLPSAARRAGLFGGAFYEIDISNSFFAILYVELIRVTAKEEIDRDYPCLHSYVHRRDAWMESLIGYYSSGRVAIKKLLLAVLFRGPAAPRNAVGETRRDSLPIVLALSS